MSPSTPPGTTFLTTELTRALNENAFCIHSSSPADPPLNSTATAACASATVELLEGNEIVVDLFEDGWRIRNRSPLYDTLDSLLLNNSPKAMLKVNEKLTSKLEALATLSGGERKEERVGVEAEAEGSRSGSKGRVEEEADGKVDANSSTANGGDGDNLAFPSTNALPLPTPSPHDPLSSELLPPTSATLTIRCIKSFAYRTEKNLVLRGVDLTRVRVGELVEMCRKAVKTTAGFKAYRTVDFDTLKLYTQAHSHKTMNLIINLENDDWILDDPEKTMADVGAVNETEYSLFNREEYEKFKANPEIKWD